jgi:hypothetical protein
MRETRTTTHRGKDSAVSITVGYVLNIGIATLVLSSFLLGMQGTFRNVEDTVSESQAESLAQKVSTEVTQADRLARIGDGSSGVVTFEIPDTIGDSGYDVNVTEDEVVVSTSTGGVVTQGYNTTSDVDGGLLTPGSENTIEYDGSPDPPEVNVVG